MLENNNTKKLPDVACCTVKAEAEGKTHLSYNINEFEINV